MQTYRLLALFLCLCPLASYAQTAEVGGAVEDPSGAVIANASVEFRNQDTGVRLQNNTNHDGVYHVVGIEPGKYDATVRASGFKTLSRENIVFQVSDRARIDFKMQLGQTDQTINVDGSGVEINVIDGSVSTVIDRQFVQNLPLNGRSFQSLLYLTPGVAPNLDSAGTDLAQGQFVVNGQHGDSNYWVVDGAGANIGLSQFQPGPGIAGSLGGVNVLGGTSALVSVDDMQEFRLQTSTYSPEFGRGMGGQISIQTRSGTNRFHGTLFEYLRNGDLDANDWFADENSLAKPLEIQNDFGGVIGGPIIKDKTFFFFSAEALKLHLPQTFLGTVPDLAIRATASPSALPYVNAYPLPKPGVADVIDAPGLAPFSATYSNPGAAEAYSLRIDQQLPNRLNVFGRYSHAPSNIAQHGTDSSSGNTVLTTTGITKTATLGATWAPSTHLVDDLRLNYSIAGGKSVFDALAISGSGPFPNDEPFAPGLSYTNSQMIMLPSYGTNMRMWKGPQTVDYQHQFNIVNAVTSQEGRHTIKVGVDYRRLTPSVPAYGGVEQIAPFFDTVQHFAAGQSDVLETAYTIPSRLLLQNLSLFGQDSWRVSSRMNLTYGLRWDVDYAPGFEGGPQLAAITGFSTTDLSNLALAPTGTPIYRTKFGNVAPRVGGAYRLRTSAGSETVLRGGFGIFYGLADTELFNSTYAQGAYPDSGINIFNSYTNAAGITLPYVPFPVPQSLVALPAIQAPTVQNGEQLSGIDPDLNTPYALEWNVAVEQSLGKAQSFSLSYLGAADKRLIASETVSNPNPRFASAYLVANVGSSNYQALQAQFQRRLTNGLQASASYVLSHGIGDTACGACWDGIFSEIRANRGPLNSDVRHTLSGAFTYSIPGLKRDTFSRLITTGWTANSVVQAHTAAPNWIADTTFNNVSAKDLSLVIRPDVVPGQPIYLYGRQYPGGKALNYAAFADPPVDPTTKLPSRQGDLGSNALRGLGFAQWDLTAAREFPIHDSLRLQFRAEMFNVINHPNFGPLNGTFQPGNQYFGQATQMLNEYLGGLSGNGTQNPLYAPGSPRSIELVLRMEF
jgi:Carboxypeptidase regulatory-like domain